MKNTTMVYLQRKIAETLQSIDRQIDDVNVKIELLQGLTTRTKKDGTQFANFSQNFINENATRVNISLRANYSQSIVGYLVEMHMFKNNSYNSIELYVDCTEGDVQAVFAERDKKIDYYKQEIDTLTYKKNNLQRIFNDIIAPFIDQIETEEQNGYSYLSMFVQKLL